MVLLLCAYVLVFSHLSLLIDIHDCLVARSSGSTSSLPPRKYQLKASECAASEPCDIALLRCPMCGGALLPVAGMPIARPNWKRL